MFKDILVHLRGATSDAPVLAIGLELARLFDAHMECAHIAPDTAALMPRQGEPLLATRGMLTSALDVLEAEAKKRSKAAYGAYSKFCQENDLLQTDSPASPSQANVAWRDFSGETTDRSISAARVHDLVVTAGTPDESLLLSTDTGRLVLGGGKPLVLAPQQSVHTNHFRTVAIAWKDAPEAARAVTAAMPILSKAHRVIVLSAHEDDSKARECLDCCESVANQLRWHGLAVEVRYVVPAGRAAADAVLETAQQAGADMLVMGGYGHSRLRELIFGGFTRRILRGVGLPVFIFH